jgi:hypothetical protein
MPIPFGKNGFAGVGNQIVVATSRSRVGGCRSRENKVPP